MVFFFFFSFLLFFIKIKIEYLINLIQAKPLLYLSPDPWILFFKATPPAPTRWKMSFVPIRMNSHWFGTLKRQPLVLFSLHYGVVSVRWYV